MRARFAAAMPEARYGRPVGPPATISCEPRQARKGATVAVDLCAGVRLAGRPL